jgi:hypothetical protein
MGGRGWGDGRVYTRSGSQNLWIEYRVDGIQYREPTGSKDRHVAEALLRQRMAEKTASQVRLMEFKGPQRLTLYEACRRWNVRCQNGCRLRALSSRARCHR